MAHNPLREAIVIRRCDNLNKDNFWDTAMELCPITTKCFCDWIDRYKYGVQWEAMFLPMVPETPNIKATGRKFHDLPLEMQVGIIFRFFYDGWNDYVEGVNILDPSSWVEIICILFNEREEKFKQNGG